MKYALIAASLLAVTGCTTPEQQLADDQTWCIRYGYHTGTEGMADCVSREQQTKYLGAQVTRAGILSSIK